MPACVGIDVSKATLDVAIHGLAEVRKFANSPAGFRQLAAWVLPQHPDQVVLEATGGYEQAALDALFMAGLRPLCCLRRWWRLGSVPKGKSARLAFVRCVQKQLS